MSMCSSIRHSNINILSLLIVPLRAGTLVADLLFPFAVGFAISAMAPKALPRPKRT